MTTPTQGEHAQTALAHELFAAAQLAPGEGIEDAVSRIAAALTAAPAQPAAPQGVAYAELPEPDATTVGLGAVWNRHSMRDFADRTHALRASHGQAPAGVALEELLILLGSKKAWPSYYFNHKDRYECCDCGEEHDDYAEITHAETCDFTQATADRKRIKELVEILKSSTPTAQAAPAAGAVAVPRETLVAWRQWCAQSMSHAIEHEISDLLSAAPTPAAQADRGVQEDAPDPLQGAANWLAEAHGQFSPVVLSGCLMIGYNRAKRLHDAALAARKQGGKHD